MPYTVKEKKPKTNIIASTSTPNPCPNYRLMIRIVAYYYIV